MGIHWFILSAVAVILAQRWLFGRFAMKRVAYSRTFSVNRCFEGDRIEMIERLANRKMLPLPWLRVESLMHTGLKFESDDNFDVSNGQFYQNHKSLFSLMGYKQLTRRHAVHCMQRGYYRLTGASLTYGDLFGLHKHWISVPLEEELLVYPLPADRSELRLPSRSWQGDITVRRWIVEDPFLVTGVRDYQPGDPLKAVNWSATARAGKLQVHRRDFTADYKLVVLLNVEDHEEMWDAVNNTAMIERGIRLAAGFAQYAAENGLEIGFASNGHDLNTPGKPIVAPLGSGNEHLMYLLECMAKLTIVRTVPFDVLLEDLAEEWEERCDVVIVSSFIGGKMSAAIEKMKRAGHGVEWMPIGGVSEGGAA